MTHFLDYAEIATSVRALQVKDDTEDFISAVLSGQNATVALGCCSTEMSGENQALAVVGSNELVVSGRLVELIKYRKEKEKNIESYVTI